MDGMGFFDDPRLNQELSEWEQLLRSKSWQTGEAFEGDVEPLFQKGRQEEVVRLPHQNR